MVAISTRFQSERAPCGRVGEGEHYESEDAQGLTTDQFVFACGCRISRQEYHDGSIERSLVHHDGRVLVDELAAEHGAWSLAPQHRRRHRHGGG
jgi:hypothetical protein